VPLVLEITSPYDTTLRDTTGISGNVLFTHANIVSDSVVYHLYCEGIVGVYMHFGEAVAELGIPEVITAGLFSTTPP
jgi:glutamate mutase epsilon subunit